MVIKCSNTEKCYSPRAESTRINQTMGAAETYPQTAPADVGTQSQRCHNCQRLSGGVPKKTQTSVSASSISSANTDVSVSGFHGS